MKFYILSHLSYEEDKLKSSLQSNILLFSDKYDKILSTRETQKNYILQHLSETRDKKDIQVFDTPATFENYTDGVISTNILITAGRTKHLLIINTIQASPKTKETPEDLNLGNLVTLRPEAVSAIQTMERSTSYRGLPSRTLVAKVTKKEEKTVEVMICAIATSSPTNTSAMGSLYNVPKEYLKRLYI